MMRPRTSKIALAITVLVLGLVLLIESLLGVRRAGGDLTLLQMLVMVGGVALITLGLWLLYLCFRLHPAIKQYFVISLDPVEFKRKADNEIPLTLSLGGESFEISIRPVPAFSDSCEVIEVTEEGERRERITEVVTYVGTVTGQEKSSQVRFGITNHSITGYIKTGKVWWFIEPLRKYRLDANVTSFIAYRTRDLRFRLEFGDDVKQGQLIDSDEIAVSHRQSIGIIFAMDIEYLQQAAVSSFSAYDHALILLNNVNGIYQSEIGREFVMENLVVDQVTLNSDDSSDLLDQLVQSISNTSIGNLRLSTNRQKSGAEIAHLTSGKNLDGKILGVAFQPGYYGLSQQRLIWIGGGGLFGGPPPLAYMNMLIMAHEVGHNFNGEHDEGDKFCVTSFITCWDYERTIMWPTLYEDTHDEFSDGSRDPNNNNKERITDNIASRIP